MSKYFETKKGSLEDMVAGVTEGKQSEDYKQLFKKELEKAGKGIGAMSDQEKKDFFNKIDKKHTAKNEDSRKVQKMNVKKSSGEEPKKLKEETELDEKKQYHMYSTKAAAEKKAKEIGGKVEKSTAAHFQGYYAVKDVKEETELEEGAVKDFLMDVEADAGDMSLNDLIRKYYGQMGLTAQDIKKIYYRVNEEFDVNEKYVAKFSDGGKDVEVDAKQSAHDINKKLRKKVGDRMKYFTGYKKVSEEKEVKDNPTLQESIMNVWSQGAEEQEQREDEAKWLKTEEKKSLTEEKIKCPNCGHINDMGAERFKFTQKCENCGYDLTNVKSKKEGKHEKKKAMTGSPATKVDTKPEVEFDSK